MKDTPEYREQSKQRLKKIVATKINTTMIGSLASIEKHFSEFLDDPNLANAFQNARQEILDNGNHQKRNLDPEFEQYEIFWKRYELNLPIRRKG